MHSNTTATDRYVPTPRCRLNRLTLGRCSRPTRCDRSGHSHRNKPTQGRCSHPMPCRGTRHFPRRKRLRRRCLHRTPSVRTRRYHPISTTRSGFLASHALRECTAYLHRCIRSSLSYNQACPMLDQPGYLARSTISILRFLARPSGVALDATGWYWPNPSATRFVGSTPCACRCRTTSAARAAESSQLLG